MDDNVLPLRHGPEELIDDHYLLDTFLEHTPDSVYFKDDKSRFIRISHALATRLGLDDPVDAIGRTDFDFFAEDAREEFADAQRLMQSGASLVGIEERENWEDGRGHGARRRRCRCEIAPATSSGSSESRVTSRSASAPSSSWPSRSSSSPSRSASSSSSCSSTS